MTIPDEHLKALREALQATPGNIPLRRHLAGLLLESSDYEGAEAEYRRALKMDPNDHGVILGLARTFHAQGKNSIALTVLEDHMFQLEEPPASAWILHGRILVSTGKVPEGIESYRKGVGMDPESTDEELAELLGIDADPENTRVLDGRARILDGDMDDEAKPDVVGLMERPMIDFESVGGMDSIKDEIRMKIILPMTNQDLYAAYGKTVGGGILMYGPPGCGKTYLARATAGEIKADFISVGLHEVLDMWIGSSERKLHSIFEQARRNKPCVLFFDEVDALAASRTDMRTHGGRHVINQFLAELDGIDVDNEGVLILAATNAPWHLDSAFCRPGRFDKILFVPPPDTAARESILHLNLDGKPLREINFNLIAKKTDGFSGADIRSLVDNVVEAVLKEAMKTGHPVPIEGKMILKLVKNQTVTTREWFTTARNHAIYANEAGLYDPILEYLDRK
jgi:transitional endoplasmic reticulum ATPase